MSVIGRRSGPKSPMPSFTVTATAHVGALPHRAIDVVLDALPGARFDEASGDLVYRDAVEAIDGREATRLMQERVLLALRKAGLFAVRSELDAWVTELEH
jgi:hypothetical protein